MNRFGTKTRIYTPMPLVSYTGQQGSHLPRKFARAVPEPSR